MQLTDDDIREFQKIWKEEFGEEIDVGYARSRASTFLGLLVLLLKHQAKQSSPSSRSTPSQD